LRDPITEHYLCGKSQTELAISLGLNQSTVHRRLDKGLEELRRKLKRDDEPELALAALPLFLQQLNCESGSSALRHALTKIGLSGVGGGGATSRAGVLAAWKILLLWFGLVAIAGSAVYLLRTDPPPTPAPSVATLLTSLDQVPAAVRATFEQNCPGATIREMEKKRDGSRIVYDFDVMINEKPWEIRISQSGELIWKKSG
jgi:DNA-binding Lrp family transcriptional regulator